MKGIMGELGTINLPFMIEILSASIDCFPQR
jgi:hypothetical protein